MKAITATLVILFLLTICINAQNDRHGNIPNKKKVIVEEVLQVKGYTYLRVMDAGKEQWLALPTIQAKKGDIYYYSDPMPMTNFESKELGRKFESIYFLASVKPEDENAAIVQEAHPEKKPSERENISIEQSEGVISIAELYENKDKYAGKVVKVKGKVTKYSEKILYNNWIHLQDGTNYRENFDITITTKNQSQIGDIVTIEGTVTLDKDFGYGYFFALIIEEATVLK